MLVTGWIFSVQKDSRAKTQLKNLRQKTQLTWQSRTLRQHGVRCQDLWIRSNQDPQSEKDFKIYIVHAIKYRIGSIREIDNLFSASVLFKLTLFSIVYYKIIYECFIGGRYKDFHIL